MGRTKHRVANWADRPCAASASCLTCTRSTCIEDETPPRSQEKARRIAVVLAVLAEKRSVTYIMHRFGFSRRRAHHYIKRPVADVMRELNCGNGAARHYIWQAKRLHRRHGGWQI